MKRRNRTTGTTFVEVILALIVFLMMALVFSAVCPMSYKAAQTANYYSEAEEICQHKLDELRGAGYSRLDYGTTPVGCDLGPAGLMIVDSMSSPPAAGTYPATYYFTNTDNIVNNGSNIGLFPTGAVGTIVVNDFHNINANVPATYVKQITVSITWTTVGNPARTYSVTGLMAESMG
jgi:hypothetical protein